MYELSPVFVIRMCGAPIDALEVIGMPHVAALAREVLAREAAVEALAARTIARLDAVDSPERALERSLRHRIRRRVGKRAPAEADLVASMPALAEYNHGLATVVDALAVLERELGPAFDATRAQLYRSAREILPRWLAYSSESLSRTFEGLSEADAQVDTASARERERRLALYLQRVCTKNETVSEYGPVAYGRITSDVRGWELDVSPGMRDRVTYLEQWVVRAIVAAMNEDPQVRPELAPRLHPHARRDGDHLVREDEGREIQLSPTERELVARCDGSTPAHALDVDALTALAARGAILWEVELPWMDTFRLPDLIADAKAWRDGPVRTRWLATLTALDERATRFADADAAERRALFLSVQETVKALGQTVFERGRKLYGGGNPIGEDCARAAEARLGRDVADVLVHEAAPWFDFWRDCFSYCTARMFGQLSELYRRAPRPGGRVSLSAFLAFLDRNGIAFTSTGVTSMANDAFQDVKRHFHAAVAHREDAPEWHLTRDELHCLRRTEGFQLLEGLSYPSADVQLVARTPEQIARGDYELMVAELHMAAVTNIFPLYHFNPDQATHDRYLARVCCGEPLCYFGQQLMDATSHTTVQAFRGLPQQYTYAAPQRGRREWRSVRPADAEVILDEQRRDLRVFADGRDLGSLVRDWMVCFGFHPFLVPRSPHMPRIRVGPRTLVQRQTWTVTEEELGHYRVHGVDAALVLAIERLRAARGLPRWVYIRPSEEALKRELTGSRDKDLKPIYVDLESYTFMELFARWMEKYKVLEIVEMLPDPTQIPWRDVDGTRRTFEIRVVVAPSA